MKMDKRNGLLCVFFGCFAFQYEIIERYDLLYSICGLFSDGRFFLRKYYCMAIVWVEKKL